MRISDIPQIAELSIPEKILLLEDLWDDISGNELNISMPDSHKKELDSRLDQFNANSDRLLSRDELKDRINQRK